MPQSLNSLKGEEFEDFVSAVFQCSGYYVERNIIEREENKEVLELDIVATRYDMLQSKSLIVEVKSGTWGFPDLFKIKGWLDYLKYKNGIFVTNVYKKDYELYKKKAKKLGIELIQLKELSYPAVSESLKKIIPDFEFVESDFATWIDSYRIERKILKDLKNYKNNIAPNEKSFQKLDEYYFLLNCGIFFEESIVDRVRKLYETFQKFPRISARCGNELIGRSFDKEVKKLNDNIYEATYYDCKYNRIQISTYIEHRARLALLKNAVDYLLERKRKDIAIEVFAEDFEEELFHYLPSSFKRGINQLERHSYFYKYPLFWQWFMWIFGGFILEDYKEREYEILSQKTGIPVDEIPKAFESYQILFPQDDGWFINLAPQSSIRVLKMFPRPFSGIGANYRKLIYTKNKKFEELNFSGSHTYDDLKKWYKLKEKLLTLEIELEDDYPIQ